MGLPNRIFFNSWAAGMWEPDHVDGDDEQDWRLVAKLFRAARSGRGDRGGMIAGSSEPWWWTASAACKLRVLKITEPAEGRS